MCVGVPALADRVCWSSVGWTFMSVAWPCNKIEAQIDCAAKAYYGWRSSLATVSDMNVQATESQILPLRVTGGKLRRHFTWAVQSSGAFLSVADEACSTPCEMFFKTPDALPQNSAWPGVLGNGMTSRMLVMPVISSTARSRPRPKPECGTVPYFLRSVYHQ